MSSPNQSTGAVFINCPFDDDYNKLLNALLFTIYDCGFFPRIAKESADSGENRLGKIYELIRDCRYAIHDLSRVKIDPNTGLPRFNMVLEVGVYLGAKKFIGPEKVCLIMDSEQFRYRNFCSDLAGVDIEAHNDDSFKLICVVRDWLRANQEVPEDIPDGTHIFQRYNKFLVDLPDICQKFHWNANPIGYHDYTSALVGWLKGTVGARQRRLKRSFHRFLLSSRLKTLAR